MTKQKTQAILPERDRPAKPTPEMVEAATDELIESGRLLDTHFQAANRDNVRRLAAEVLCAALAASGGPDKISKRPKKAC